MQSAEGLIGLKALVLQVRVHAQALPQILALRPGVVVLMATGYSDEDIAPLREGRPQVHSIQKPFSMRELKRKLDDLGIAPPAAPTY